MNIENIKVDENGVNLEFEKLIKEYNKNKKQIKEQNKIKEIETTFKPIIYMSSHTSAELNETLQQFDIKQLKQILRTICNDKFPIKIEKLIELIVKRTLNEVNRWNCFRPSMISHK